MAKPSKAFKLGRNADNGRFATVEHARDNPRDHVVENVPKKGYGDTKNEK